MRGVITICSAFVFGVVFGGVIFVASYAFLFPEKTTHKSTTNRTRREIPRFLRTRLDSQNYKDNVSKEEYEKTKDKYDRANFRLKILKG